MTGKSNNAMNSIPQDNGKNKSFETLKRNYEAAYISGGDYSEPLTELATAIAYSVLAKCIDPQRKTAANSRDVSQKGYNPALLELRQGMTADLATLENTRRISDNAFKMSYDADGNYIVIEDKDAAAALEKLVDITLSDGIDLMQTAACALIEQAAEHADGEKWLDRPYTVRRLKKKVYIKLADSAAYKDEQTTPIQEVYRAVRRQIMSSRAVQTDPRNGYTYIEEMTEDGLDTVYLRMGKYADIGSFDNDGNYTADIQTVQTYETLVSRLNLTASEATVIDLRMKGNGYRAIATYLGVTPSAVKNRIYNIRKKAEKIGFTPDGYNTNE